MWPAVPFSSINENALPATSSPRRPRSENGGANLPPSPPQLALNGITTSAPKGFVSLLSGRSSNGVSAETGQRRKELQDEHALYPLMAGPESTYSHDSAGSPVIPLSPDPFGRYPSTPDAPLMNDDSGPQYWESQRRPSVSSDIVHDADDPAGSRSTSRATSRFSFDSSSDNEPDTPSSATVVGGVASSIITTPSAGSKEVKPTQNRTTLMTVKGLTKLWKKGPKASVSVSPTPPPPVPAPPSVAAHPGYNLKRSASPETSLRPSIDRPTTSMSPLTPTFGRFPGSTTPNIINTNMGERRPSQEKSTLAIPNHYAGGPANERMRNSSSSPPPPKVVAASPPPPLPPTILHRSSSASEVVTTGSTMTTSQLQRSGSAGAGVIMTGENLNGKNAHMGLDRLRFDQESPYPNIRRYFPQPPPQFASDSNRSSSANVEGLNSDLTTNPADHGPATTTVAKAYEVNVDTQEQLQKEIMTHDGLVSGGMEADRSKINGSATPQTRNINPSTIVGVRKSILKSWKVTSSPNLGEGALGETIPRPSGGIGGLVVAKNSLAESRSSLEKLGKGTEGTETGRGTMTPSSRNDFASTSPVIPPLPTTPSQPVVMRASLDSPLMSVSSLASLGTRNSLSTGAHDIPVLYLQQAAALKKLSSLSRRKSKNKSSINGGNTALPAKLSPKVNLTTQPNPGNATFEGGPRLQPQ